MNVDLILPALFWPDAEINRAVAKEAPKPGLAALWARAHHQRSDALAPQQWLARALGLDDGSFALASLAQDIPDAAPGFWMRADPVQLQPRRDQLLMFDLGDTAPDLQACQLLASRINAFLRDDGIEFYAPTPTRWYVRLPKNPVLTTTPPQRVLERHIDPYLPRGDNMLYWHRLLNELQMLLYTDPVNDARELAGKPPVSSLWLWGGAHVPTERAASWPKAQCLSDAAWLRGMSSEVAPLPSGAEALQRDSWVWLDALVAPMEAGDGHAWMTALSAIDQDWVQPLWRALMQGRISALTLHLPEAGMQLVATPGARWRFWQRPRSPWREVA
ncbi:hypothetical protein ACTSKR_10750 [Chitinibacteraceae bacterium HSL-7]